ncbi:asparagine synthase-related protein [Dechloromonas sp. XY25]|uniref:asparagine synthase (glutamine-hydrolyzing) n=1 Tax=Dechloromonas hankyongensis TaxID=2908002 RepID=A0ABS9K3L8_9RHOO|nr:asparagine synthase-related protein [Dechloromonas hankyongensis]MCG2577757.1 asparagine synthase-related protein [Dechloromonas hankyongensis]
MKDQLSGDILLDRLFGASEDSAALEAFSLRGGSVSRRESCICALIGSPRPERNIEQSQAGLSPADLVLQLWAKYGPQTPAHLRGGFAVAIVDRTRKSIFLAVDRFAMQTLCYSFDGNRLSFSDRADCVAGRGNELDSQAIFDFLFFHMIPAPRTIFRQVQRLPAAHSLLVDANGIQEKRYWALQFEETTRHAFPAAKETFLELIRKSVAEEIEGHDQVGAFLSGGTDSSTVAGMLCKIQGKPAKTYSIGFEAEGYDEMEYARLAARHFGCEHHEYYVTPDDLLASIPAVAQHHDQPFGNSSALPSYYCAKMARQDGCTKILAGDGGDELFGGNSRYAMQRIFNLYSALPGGLRSLIEPACGDESVLRKIPGLRQAVGYVRHSRNPMPDRLQSFNLVMRLDPANILSADFLRSVELDEPLRHMRSTWQQCEADSLINRMLAYDWRYTLADSDLPKVRGATAMAGIEVGYPLLENCFTDFSMKLDPEWKLKRLKLRWFFKEALRGFLPDEILTKKKHGFGLPYGPWMARTPALHKLAHESLHALAGRGIIQEQFVDTMLERHLPEHPGYYGEMVWILLMLEQWIKGQDSLRIS